MNLLKGSIFRRNAGRGAVARIFLLAVLVSASGVGKTQRTGQQPLDPPDPLKIQDGSDDKHNNDPMRAASAERQAKLRNEERQKRLVADTDRLLTLVTQLHEDVAKTDKNILSIDVVKRADEIEKLAHSVKERMKD
jgi:hypothetical protein